MKSVVASVLAMMVLTGTALAAIPSTMAYKLATEPLISGKVVSVNDHMMVVDTDQGQQVTLAVDTKTMVPTDLAPGMAMRVEFKAMPDGHLYARRVIPIRNGMNTERELAYSHCGASETSPLAAGDGAGDAAGAAAAGAAAGAATDATSDSAKEGGSSESLPQTAGSQPLILLAGLLALASAGILATSRRLRSA
jgi:LPXTG-motif cell wall-anchored protein